MILLLTFSVFIVHPEQVNVSWVPTTCTRSTMIQKERVFIIDFEQEFTKDNNLYKLSRSDIKTISKNI